MKQLQYFDQTKGIGILPYYDKVREIWIDVELDEYDYDYSEFDDDMVNYIMYLKNHNKLLELFISKQKDYNYL